MSMNFSWFTQHWKKIVLTTALVSLVGAAVLFQKAWMPYAQRFIAYIQNENLDAKDEEEDKAGPSETPDTLTLSPTAWKNIGLATETVQPRDFVKIVSVPASVVERPGRSKIEIAAPMTGVVTRVYPLERQAVLPGDPLFDLRLTHEDVVSAQSEFLNRLQTLDIAKRELTRLNKIADVIPGKRIIEQEYKRDSAVVALEALKQTLILHGMSEGQIATMEKTRKVLQKITVVAPPFADNGDAKRAPHKFHVQSIAVNRGESVASGELLGVLADHWMLYVEGMAFEDDANRLIQASKTGGTIQVAPVSGEYSTSEILDLKIQSISDQVDAQSRALKFYLLLPNKVLVEANETQGQNFVAWHYRPGQRMEARIPMTEVMRNKIVLPPDAVVIDGPNAFVFEQNGENFDRIDVHVLFKDKDTVVLENDGQLVDSIIAMNGAYQMHLALKNQSGGAIDPHAGHNH